MNGIEFPVVSIGQARLRVNLMPQHTHEHLDTFVDTFERCLGQAQRIMDKHMQKQEELERKARL